MLEIYVFDVKVKLLIFSNFFVQHFFFSQLDRLPRLWQVNRA